jgi:hypothetical protein
MYMPVIRVFIFSWFSTLSMSRELFVRVKYMASFNSVEDIVCGSTPGNAYNFQSVNRWF